MQNRAPAGRLVPQLVQEIERAVPQLMQNRAVSGLLV
jgi:hypothetical protein